MADSVGCSWYHCRNELLVPLDTYGLEPDILRYTQLHDGIPFIPSMFSHQTLTPGPNLDHGELHPTLSLQYPATNYS